MNIPQTTIADNHHEIEEPNYTQLPNVFFDYWMSRLTHVEFKVLCCIARKTFGWRRKKDSISISQIVKMSGASKQSTINALHTLENHKLVIKQRHQSDTYGNEPNTYTVRVLSPGKSPANDGASTIDVLPPSTMNGQGACTTIRQTKETEEEKKELPPLTPPTPPLEKVVVVSSVFQEIGGDADSWERLRKLYSEEQINAAAEVAKSQGTRPDIVFGWIRDCIEKGWKPKASGEDVVRRNKRVMVDRFNRIDGMQIGGETITVLNKHVEFLRGGASNIATYIEYTDPAFEQKMEVKIAELNERKRRHEQE